MSRLLRLGSRISSLPVLRGVSPSPVTVPEEAQLQGYLNCQKLAQTAAKEIARMVQPGWTEDQTASLLESFLRDNGVGGFFHYPFAWFGERTRFDGIQSYKQYQPSRRILLENEVFILDVAPIYQGYTCDIGYTQCLGTNPEYDHVVVFLSELREKIPGLFEQLGRGDKVWNEVDQWIQEAGFENIHKKYPFSVLGHRLCHGISDRVPARLLHFGWQSYWALLSRGLLGQLLTQDHEGDLLGLWAIEPHIGTSQGVRFGAKFEEILVVTRERAYWLERELCIGRGG